MKKILAISGSLREKSFNSLLLNAVKEALPQEVEFTKANIGELPLFNEELEANFPSGAQTLKDQIISADAIVIATPEYNRSVPGVLKNAIDWASRPYGKNAFVGKPVLVIGASVGPLGTALAQYHLKQILAYLDAKTIGQPEFYITFAQEKFDADGNLTNEHAKENLKTALDTLLARI